LFCFENVFILLLFQIESAWIENFAEDYAEGISSKDLDLVMQALVSKVKCRKLSVTGLPQSVREFMVMFHVCWCYDKYQR